MKHCPSCSRTYTDEALNFCLEDGTPLVTDSSMSQGNPTLHYPPPRDTSPSAPQTPPQSYPSNPTPPSYNPYQPSQATPNQAVPFQPQPQWSPMPAAPPRRSGAIWWVLGILAVLLILGVGIIVVIIAVASMNSQPNRNSLANSNRNSNRTTNTNTDSNSTPKLPASFTDDFTKQTWTTGSGEYGQMWYADDQYHIKAKEKVYIDVYGPTPDYNTENATVKVTARNVDGVSPTTGYGLVVHGEKKNDKLEDYSFLIYSGAKPQYKIVLHKEGNESTLVPWTETSTIRSGTSPNQLEVRIKGTVMTFYVNSQLVKSIIDTEGYKRGRAGFYSSDAHEVAFDDLEINR